MSDKLSALKLRYEKYNNDLIIAKSDYEKALKLVKEEFDIKTIKEAEKKQGKLDTLIEGLQYKKSDLLASIEEKMNKLEEELED